MLSATYQSKRNAFVRYHRERQTLQFTVTHKHYEVRGSEEDLQFIIALMQLCHEPQSGEALKEALGCDGPYLIKWLSALMKLNILYVKVAPRRGIDQKLQAYITHYYVDHEARLDALEAISFYVMDAPREVMDYLGQNKVNFMSLDALQSNFSLCDTWLITGVEDDLCVRQALIQGANVLLIRRSGDAYGLLAMTAYDAQLLKHFRDFALTSDVVSPFAKRLLGQNTLMLLLDKQMRGDAPNVRILRADGLVDTFHLKDSFMTAAYPYYRRAHVRPLPLIDQIMAFESLQRSIPHVIHNINVDVRHPKQSPIACYEMTLNKGEKKLHACGFHQDYLQAAKQAITWGLERYLNESGPPSQARWICQDTSEDFELEGLLWALNPLVYGPTVPLEGKDGGDLGATLEKLASFLRKQFKVEATLGFTPVVLEGQVQPFGRVILVVDHRQVWESPLVYRIMEMACQGLYMLIAKCSQKGFQPEALVADYPWKTVADSQVNQDMARGVKVKFTEMPGVYREISKQAMHDLLSEALAKKGILVKEEPWIYQGLLEASGFYVGRYSRVV